MTTEYVDYSYPGLNIIPAKVSLQHNISKERQPLWGQRMLWGLEKVETELIIVLQEDFFIKGPVNHSKIEEMIDYMLTNKEVKCFHFTPIKIRSSSPFVLPNVLEIGYNTSYRVSAQPAIWRTEELKTIIKDSYTPWQFEVIGSKVSGKQKTTYLMYGKDYLETNPIYPYVATGILKGKWNKEVVPLFKENGININYNERGFYKRDSLISRIKSALKWRLKLMGHILKSNNK